MTRDEMMKDLEFCENALCRPGGRSEVWQDRMIYGMLKVLLDILLTMEKREKQMTTNQSQYEEMIIPVRCKDCQYNYGNAEGREYNPNDIVCTYFNTDGMDASDYCSYGERRTDEAD